LDEDAHRIKNGYKLFLSRASNVLTQWLTWCAKKYTLAVNNTLINKHTEKKSEIHHHTANLLQKWNQGMVPYSSAAFKKSIRNSVGSLVEFSNFKFPWNKLPTFSQSLCHHLPHTHQYWQWWTSAFILNLLPKFLIGFYQPTVQPLGLWPHAFQNPCGTTSVNIWNPFLS